MERIKFLRYKYQILPVGKANNGAHVIFLIVMMLSHYSNAQHTINISQAINSGLANKKNITAGKTDITIKRLQTQMLNRKYWPQLSLGYTYFYNPILQTSILPIGIFNPTYPADATKSVQFGTKWTQSAGLTAIQPLIDLSIQRHINEAKLEERIAGLSQEQSEYEMAFTIAQTYIDIFLQELKIKSLIADTNRTYINYSLLKNKFDEKRLLKSDLNNSKINHNNSVQFFSDGIASLMEDKVYLLFLMGVSDIDKWDFEVDSISTNNYFSTDAVDRIAISRMPELQQLNLQRQLTTLQVKTENSKNIPTISFKGFLGVNQFANAFNPVEANTWFGLSYVGLDVKVPILFGESPRNKIQQLRLQSSQYNLQNEDKTHQYEKDMLTAKVRMNNIKKQLKTQEQNIELSAESIDIFQARVQEGQEASSTLNLEEANLQVLEANYQINKRQLWVNWLNYLKASGQLTMLWK